MTREEFANLLSDFTLSAESGDGERFAQHFAEDGIYYDYVYGPHQGRADIAHMMQNLFHRDATDNRWEMFDPVFDGTMGYAWWLSSFVSTIPQFKGQRVDRRHEPIHPARRADRGIPQIRQWRRRDVAARRRAGAHGQGVSALDRLAHRAAGDTGLSGAAEGLARREILKANENAPPGKRGEQGRRHELSAHSLRSQRQDRDHHAESARPHECVDADYGARRAPCDGDRGRR